MSQPAASLADVFALSDEDPEFSILHPGNPTDSRPLIVWVHPGDACENDHPERSVRTASLALQKAMGLEVGERLVDHDVVVLHRLSSAYAFEVSGRVAGAYARALHEAHAHPSAAVLYGDDLKAASAWILRHARAASRPSVWLTGAYADPQHGCVTAVGQALARAGARIEVSPHSPCEAGSAQGAWAPPRRPRSCP